MDWGRGWFKIKILVDINSLKFIHIVYHLYSVSLRSKSPEDMPLMAAEL